MKNILLILWILILPFIIYAQSIENGIVKEYQGKKEKTVLPGVELMVNGAPSTISDLKGEFTLKFATLNPGDKISYSDIYKEGYVIFNKDALDAWRISNKGIPFTIIMCKETDFRQLKKKFYDIIEKSYRSEYERQKAIAEQNATDAMQLRLQLQMIEKEYNQKMADINTYVELFSRIDRNEMDSVEAKALDYMEAGEIDKAIQTYEELHLEKNMKEQFSKWDAADEMHKAAKNMESEVQSDLTILAGKMQKQISLYEMGGYKYRAKKSEMIRNLINLLNKLQPVTGTQYNELLGEMLVKSVENLKPKKQLSALRQAAALPSFAGLCALAGIYELEKPNEELVDSIHNMYSSALVLIENSNDSLASLIRKKLSYIPDGYFHNEDGNVYPYRLLPDGKAQLVGQGPNYSTHLEGEIKLPDAILVKDSLRSIVSIGEYAFGNNLKLRKIILPAHCKEVRKRAFTDCAPLTIVVNSELQSVYANKSTDLAFPKEVQLVFNSVPKHVEWIAERCETFANDSTVDISPMCIALADYYQCNNDPETAFTYYEYVVEKYLYLKNYEQATLHAKKSSKIDKLKSHYLMSLCYYAQKDYPAAIDECKKCLTLKNAKILNHLAYLYAKLEPKGDFKRAHATIDQAIELAGSNFEKANFYDSKGEFFLMQGMEDMALDCMNKALSLDSQYMSNTTTPSKLYSHFNTENSQENEDEINRNKIRMEVIKSFRNWSIFLMASDFYLSRLEKSQNFDYSR